MATVTLVFTDISDSVRVMRALGARYDDVLREMRHAVREAVESRGGRVVDMVGDSTFSLFEQASPALDAAADAQRAAVRLELPVRVGVHTGEAAVDEEGVRGLTVHRGARVCGAAQPGQVVISGATDAFVDGYAGPELKPLGSFVLKDFDRPVPLYQLVVPGIENDFPPLRIGRDGLPRGTVTLVFSDVERSTQLLREMRGGYADMVEEHRRLLREAYEAHGGHIVDTEGDATFAAFPRAADALAAAADAQRALASLPVRIRMGVHTGEPEVAGDRYVGLSVNRAARICAAANGGQVLVSEATATLAVSDELPGVTLADRGVHRLKDFDRPERLFQMNVNGMPAHFPPLRIEAPPPVPRRSRRRWTVAIAAAVAGAAVVVGLVAFRDAGTPSALARVDVNAVGVIDPERNAVIASIPVGRRPTNIAAGKGSVWVANTDDGTVARIDPETGEVTRTVSVGGDPGGIAIGEEGLWVGALVGRRRAVLARMDADSESIQPIAALDTRYLRRIEVVPSVVADRGAAWLAVGAQVLRADATTGSVRRIRGIDHVAGIAIGAGAVWVADQPSSALLRLNPTTGVVIGRTPIRGVPAGVAIGEGAVWVLATEPGVGGFGSGVRVVRVDPFSGAAAAVIDVPAAGAFSVGIAVGERGVWVVGSDPVVSRIDPKTNEVTATIPLGNRADGIAVGEGYVWVTVY